MKKSELRQLIRQAIKEQTAPWVSKGRGSKKKSAECVSDEDCGYNSCCNRGFCRNCKEDGTSTHVYTERKKVDGKKTIMCCCALSAPNLTECVGPFDGCADCCLAGVSDGCGGGDGWESPLYTFTKHI